MNQLKTWAEAHHSLPIIDYKVFAVIGSRDFTDLSLVRKVVRDSLPRPCIVVSGGARGVDQAARAACDPTMGLYYKPFHVGGFEWENSFLGKQAGHIRNDVLIYYLKLIQERTKLKSLAIIISNYPITPGSDNARKECVKHGVPYRLIFKQT